MDGDNSAYRNAEMGDTSVAGDLAGRVLGGCGVMDAEESADELGAYDPVVTLLV
jgi:hypothetical protein